MVQLNLTTSQNVMDGYIFLFCEDKVLVRQLETPTIPQTSDLVTLELELGNLEEFNVFRGKPCLYGELASGLNVLGFDLCEVRSLFASIDEELFHVVAHAYHLVNWDRTTRYCGFCGEKVGRHPEMRAKLCPGCGQTVFPRISPAAIVAIVKDDQLLLARGHRFEFFSVLAGFIEPGETIEDGLKREVREEVGIEIKNLNYFSSQPWPFPDSLMIGFTAEYASGELKLDESEIVEAGWFTVDKLPMVPGKISIAGHMIEWFRQSMAAAVK